MTLSELAKSRLADIVELQPTKNSELIERWGVESGSEVHQFLESELADYYYRDDNSLIRATPEANDLVDVEPGIETDPDNGNGTKIRVPQLQAQVIEVLPPADGGSDSVVRVLHKVKSHFDVNPDVDEVRSALQALKRKGIVETVYRTVPTYRLGVDRDELVVTVID